MSLGAQPGRAQPSRERGVEEGEDAEHAQQGDADEPERHQAPERRGSPAGERDGDCQRPEEQHPQLRRQRDRQVEQQGQADERRERGRATPAMPKSDGTAPALGPRVLVTRRPKKPAWKRTSPFRAAASATAAVAATARRPITAMLPAAASGPTVATAIGMTTTVWPMLSRKVRAAAPETAALARASARAPRAPSAAGPARRSGSPRRSPAARPSGAEGLGHALVVRPERVPDARDALVVEAVALGEQPQGLGPDLGDSATSGAQRGAAASIFRIEGALGGPEGEGLDPGELARPAERSPSRAIVRPRARKRAERCAARSGRAASARRAGRPPSTRETGTRPDRPSATMVGRAGG